MLSSWLFLVLGFIFLIKGADFLVDGASSFARKFGVSSLVIGLTIVAFGTSVPELIINIFASLSGSADIAIGNILGSNIANTFLILGILALVMPLSVKDKTVWREMPFNIFATIVLYLLVNVTFVDGNTFRGLTRIDGIVLLSFFLIFIFYIFIIRKIDLDKKQDVSFPAYSLPSAILMVIGGLVGLTLGGKWIVNSSVSIATNFGVSQSLIGLTIVAIGTSLPELATSVMAVYKKNIDIAIGNIIGSNIFNIFWILGISSLIAPLPFSSSINRDIYIAFIASFLLFLLMFIGKRHLFERWQGVLFVLLYIIYIIFIIMAELVR